MPSTNERSLSAAAWGLSVALHGAVVWLAILFAAQVKPVLNEEIFQWDVALVEALKTDSARTAMAVSALDPAKQVLPPVQPPTHVARPRPVEAMETVMNRVAPQHSAQVAHPPSEAPKPIEQREHPLPPVNSAQDQIAEPVERQTVEVPKTEPEALAASKESEPVPSVEPVMAQRQPIASPLEATDARPVETHVPPTPSESLVSSVPGGPAPSSSETPVQTAKLVPGPDSKVDHRWLAESLWRRVAELKRYPSSARLNGQEGKVILKAIIRADGQLAGVSVQKSSGHTVLDAAAIEAVKLAFPLQMKQPINKPEIVVSLPIVYSLAN